MGLQTLEYGPPGLLGSHPGSYELGGEVDGTGAPYNDIGGSLGDGVMLIGIAIPEIIHQLCAPKGHFQLTSFINKLVNHEAQHNSDGQFTQN